MNVIFSEVVQPKESDVVVIVAGECGGEFISDKLGNLFDKNVVSDIIHRCKDLKYGNVKSFNVAVDNKLIEVVIACSGKRWQFQRACLEKLGGYIFDAIRSKNAKICIINNVESANSESSAAYIASGLVLKSWVFDKYKSEKPTPVIDSIACQTNYIGINERTYEHLKTVSEGVFLVRRLVTEPSNFMDPDQLLGEAMLLKKFGVKVSVLDAKQMAKLGMNAILGVGKGSDKPAYVIVMEYATDKKKDPIALIGKGLTFDSGGVSLKPSSGMADMKCDMTGAAVVIGAIKTLAFQKAKVNVVGVIGVVENMISGKAQKPGDVVYSMSGKTIEIDNTDAEGRLVLADILWYAKEKYSPKVIIDFATLTGAIKIALGHEFAGLFSNSDELCAKLTKSSDVVGEKLWRLPLHESYEEDIKSEIADIKNVGSGRGAGSITAAMFLKHFVDPVAKWAHIDIAATEWDSKNRALSQKGATGFGVRLIDDFISKYYAMVQDGDRK